MRGLDSAIFDVDDVVVITKNGLHKNTPVLIKKWHIGKPWDIFYDCETTDDPPKIIVVNEKDLISFDQYLEDVGMLDLLNEDEDDFTIFKSLEELLPELELELEGTDLKKDCECGAEKSQVGNHSSWCPKYG